MKKQKPSSNKEVVKVEAPGENTASQSNGAGENTRAEVDKPDDKVEAQEQVKVKARTKEKSEVKPEVKPTAEKPDPDTKPEKSGKVASTR